jgi:hypothetical protein
MAFNRLGFEKNITIAFGSKRNEISLLNQISISTKLKGGIYH